MAAVAGKVADDHPCVRVFLRPEDTKRDIARHAAFDVAAEIAFAAILRDALPDRAEPERATDRRRGLEVEHGRARMVGFDALENHMLVAIGRFCDQADQATIIFSDSFSNIKTEGPT